MLLHYARYRVHCLQILLSRPEHRVYYTSHCQISSRPRRRRYYSHECRAAEHCEETRILIFSFYLFILLFFFLLPISPHTSGTLLRLNNNNIKSTIVSEVVSHNGSGPESGGGKPGRAYRGSLTCPFLLFLPKTQEELVLTVFSPFVPRTGDLCNPPSTRPDDVLVFSPGEIS